MMRKILAMLLAALMLISACAMAEGGHLTVSDLVIDMGDGEVLDLSGVDFTLAFASDELQSALRLAVDAAGSSVLNVIAGFEEDQLTLRADGISDVYAISYDDLMDMIEEAAGEMDLSESFQSGFDAGFAVGASGGEMPDELTALIDHTADIFSDALSEAGTEEVDGVEYYVYDIYVGEEQMDVLLDDLIILLDAYGQAALEDSGYDSYREMFEEANLRLDVEGEAYMSDEQILADIYVNALADDETEPATLNIYVDLTADNEEETLEIFVVLSGVDGEETEELVSFYGTYTGVDGEFGEFDMGVYTPDSDESVFYVSVCAPALQSEGLWEFYLSADDGYESVNFYIDFGSPEGQDQFYAHLIIDEEVLYIDYSGEDGVGTLSAGVIEDDDMYGFTATVEVAEDDGAWLPAAADDTVDMLTVDDEQMEKLSNEALSLLMNALAGLAEANETLGELIGSMMG